MTCEEFTNSVTDYLDAALSLRCKTEFVEHLGSCTNCQAYFEQMNQLVRAVPRLREDPGEIRVPSRLYKLLAKNSRSDRPQRSRLRYWPVLIAFVVVVIVAGTWLYQTHHPARPALEAATVDLTQWLNLRGTEQPSHPAILLPRKALDLTVDLPIVAEPGEYQVGIASSKSEPFIITTGRATVIGHVATLRVKLNLTKLHAGTYRLAVRPVSWDWTYYPLRIK